MHAYRDGRAPGSERLERLGVESIEFPATGTSEDVAMLLADSKGASLIVAVGTHNSLVEFLDKGRSGMASTFITRLRVGAKLVDAKGVGRLYRSRVSTLQVVALIAGRHVRARSGDGRHRRRRGALVDPAGALERNLLLDPGAVHVIDFRYHIVSIVAIFFALGAGVVLGAGPLKGTGTDLVQAQADRDRTALEDARAELIQAKALDKYRDDYVAKVTAGLTDGKLAGKRVAIVTMPGADGDLTNTTEDSLEKAGAQVTTRISLDSKLFDPGQRQLVEPLVNELVTADITFPQDSNTYQRAGTDPGPRHRRPRGGQDGGQRGHHDPQWADRVEAALGQADAEGPGQPGRRDRGETADPDAGQLVVRRRGGLRGRARPRQCRRGRRRDPRRPRRTAAC